MAFFTLCHAVLPFCVQKQDDGKWVFLNRGYKPVGFYSRDHFNYSDYPIAIEVPGLTDTVARSAACDGKFDGNEFFLYDDGCVPTHSAENMSAYMGRLQKLLGLKIDANNAYKSS